MTKFPLMLTVAEAQMCKGIILLFKEDLQRKMKYPMLPKFRRKLEKSIQDINCLISNFDNFIEN